ncbi:hypothetical protein PGB34_00450 [Xenophilus arseniciresistens]|uniref:ParB/Sulfiredoxin domain-containing protein n=1 Tax=Xenophilus arseniciresistens TaxID=1283306 RepID=A0AAE3N598_9BURK|nr:hypothetical protein [Xenophilus arseniciresistens]MDA7414819.1 hypothetical protein [Xenophilus arseniciresistens]
MATAQWKTRAVKPEDLHLDTRNPRIEVAADASPSAVRLKLLEHEDVLELARGIERQKGLFFGERIVTTLEDGVEVVLEGNRRVAACQMLLNRALIPVSYRARFPVASAETLAAIAKISADVAPSRKAAEPILTKRHTEQGAKPWSPVAKMRRAARLLEHLPVEEVAATLGTTVAQVNKLIRPYRLLKYALDLPTWSPQERLALEGDKLKTNPYTRLFTLSDTKAALKIRFDKDQNIHSDLSPSKFKKEMTRIARDFLLPDPATGQPVASTRTDTSVYFADLLGAASSDVSKKEAASVGKNTSPTSKDEGKSSSSPRGAHPQQTDGSTNPGPAATPRASAFMENLQCHVLDDRLIKMTTEIKQINHRKRPIAAALLLRAIFECTLVYKLQQTKTWGALVKQQTTAGRDPSLADIIKFAKNFNNGVFAEQNICKMLNAHTTQTAKSYLDGITHYKYQDIDVPTLESVANNLRQVIVYILQGH